MAPLCMAFGVDIQSEPEPKSWASLRAKRVYACVGGGSLLWRNSVDQDKWPILHQDSGLKRVIRTPVLMTSADLRRLRVLLKKYQIVTLCRYTKLHHPIDVTRGPVLLDTRFNSVVKSENLPLQ